MTTKPKIGDVYRDNAGATRTCVAYSLRDYPIWESSGGTVTVLSYDPEIAVSIPRGWRLLQHIDLSLASVGPPD